MITEVYPREGGWFVVEFEKQDIHVRVGHAVVCDCHKLSHKHNNITYFSKYCIK